MFPCGWCVLTDYHTASPHIRFEEWVHIGDDIWLLVLLVEDFLNQFKAFLSLILVFIVI